MSVDVRPRQDSGRVRQRARTRDALLEAAAALLRSGVTPAVGEVATRARVSQATAYRYFPTQPALLEAVVDREMRSALGALDDSVRPSGEPEEDVVRLARAVFAETGRHEAEHKSLLRLALDAWFASRRSASPRADVHRGGRIPFIMDALEPLQSRLGEAEVVQLAEALSLAIGIEARLVLRDVWRLGSAEAADVITWTCRALIRHALAGRNTAKGPSSIARRAVTRSRRSRDEMRRSRTKNS